MNIDGIIGQRIVAIHQTLEWPQQDDSVALEVSAILLEDGTKLMPMIYSGEGNDSDFVDFCVIRPQTRRASMTKEERRKAAGKEFSADVRIAIETYRSLMTAATKRWNEAVASIDAEPDPPLKSLGQVAHETLWPGGEWKYAFQDEWCRAAQAVVDEHERRKAQAQGEKPSRSAT